MSGKSFGPDWEPEDPLLLEEVNVVYSFDRVDGFMSHTYTATYLPKGLTMGGWIVYTAHRDEFLALLAHWNREDEKWSYHE